MLPLEVLEEACFECSNTYITQRRNELKTFLLNHPECMSGELETLMDKIMYFTTKEGKKLKDQKKKNQNQNQSKTHQNQIVE